MTAPFAVLPIEEGFIPMKLSGSLNDENFEELKRVVEEAKREVVRVHDEQGAKVKVLFDLSDFTGTYNVGAMMAMKDLADHNRPYTAKTAVFGGPQLAQVAAELTLALIGDPTISMFKTREEAVGWLKA